METDTNTNTPPKMSRQDRAMSRALPQLLRLINETISGATLAV